MKLIFYGATDCKKCDTLKQDLKALGVRFNFVDANAPDKQTECDQHNVDKLPHVVQIDDTGDVVGNWVGEQVAGLLEELRKK